MSKNTGRGSLAAGIALGALWFSGGCGVESEPEITASVSQQARRCDDGLFCTVDDRWIDGECVGRPRSCAAMAGFCSSAPVCDEQADLCVAAAPDPGCEELCVRRKPRARYRWGWAAAWRRVYRHWRRRGASCDRAEEFLEDVIARLHQPDDESSGNDRGAGPGHARCLFAGRMAGALAALDAIQMDCGDRCILRGEVIGEISAATYCELAIASGGLPIGEGWLRQPVNLCGLFHEIGCDTAFIADTVAYENDAGSCRPYTVDDHRQAWNDSRLEMCSYEPPDEPPDP